MNDNELMCRIESAEKRASMAEARAEQLESELSPLLQRVADLEAERERCLDVLEPAMRESGLEDACRQAKQVIMLARSLRCRDVDR